ncbi:MAG: hypothetical protein ACE5R4_17015 [Armatimonadota bacterium]
MTAAAHIAVGAAICSRSRYPWLGLPAAFASHFLMDAWPHFEQTAVVSEAVGLSQRLVTNAYYAVDWAALILVIILLLRRLRPRLDRRRLAYIVGGGLLADLPDWLKGIGGHDAWFATFHGALHTQTYWSDTLHRYFTDRSVPPTQGYPTEELIHSPWAWAGWALMVGWEVALIVIGARIAMAAPQAVVGAAPGGD